MMTMIDTPPPAVFSLLTLALVFPDGDSAPIDSALFYETTDPYAVGLSIGVDSEDPVVWKFARDLLLSRGLEGGDVCTWATPNDEGVQVMHITVTSPSGRAHFETPAAPVYEFLNWTFELVPSGRESDFLDIDAGLKKLFEESQA